MDNRQWISPDGAKVVFPTNMSEELIQKIKDNWESRLT